MHWPKRVDGQRTKQPMDIGADNVDISQQGMMLPVKGMEELVTTMLVQNKLGFGTS